MVIQNVKQKVISRLLALFYVTIVYVYLTEGGVIIIKETQHCCYNGRENGVVVIKAEDSEPY